MKKHNYYNSYYNNYYSNNSRKGYSKENEYFDYSYNDENNKGYAANYENTFDYVVEKSTTKKQKNNSKRNYQKTAEYISNNYTTDVVIVNTVIPKKIRRNEHNLNSTTKECNLDKTNQTLFHSEFEIQSLKCYFDKFKKITQNGIINDSLEIRSFQIQIDPLYKETVESFSIENKHDNSLNKNKENSLSSANQSTMGYQPFIFPFQPMYMNMFYPGFIPPYAVFPEINVVGINKTHNKSNQSDK